MRVVPLSARAVQHEAAVGVHRSAAQHRLGGDVSVEGSSFICESTSESFIGSGLLSTMPSAPLSVCSQMSATVCAKFGSVSGGIAISR